VSLLRLLSLQVLVPKPQACVLCIQHRQLHVNSWRTHNMGLSLSLPLLRCLSLQVLPNKGAGPRALYAALGGKMPAQAAPAAAAAPPLP
jgi:hypothetical protein